MQNLDLSPGIAPSVFNPGKEKAVINPFPQVFAHSAIQYILSPYV